MCDKCESLRRGKDFGGGKSIARDKHLKGNENRGFFMQMIKHKEHYKIVDNFEEYDRSYKEPVYCLKSVHYEHDVEPNKGNSISVEISYCPFCGEKF